jgi:hypothetical protein
VSATSRSADAWWYGMRRKRVTTKPWSSGRSLRNT